MWVTSFKILIGELEWSMVIISLCVEYSLVFVEDNIINFSKYIILPAGYSNNSIVINVLDHEIYIFTIIEIDSKTQISMGLAKHCLT